MNTARTGFGRRKIVAVALVIVVFAAVGLWVYLLTRDDLVIEQYRGGPPRVGEGQEPTALVLVDEGTIHVTTMGSSSCPAVPIDLVIIDGDIVITVDSDSDGPCTADYGPTTSVVELPDEFKDSDVVPTVTVEYA
ncbi:hypothetical protein [Sanguibacter sp. 25GB23B1]|uniref:hypothetical protein n=1 Tax=unclassified Sanguibacter TaxID=2645534 RepID=UPI0032AFC4EF